MSKPTKQILPTVVTVQEAQATLAGFERQRQALIEQHEQHTAKRREISFAAHIGDVQSSRLLDGLHEESVRFESRMASIADAINEARRRLEQVREHEAKAADRDRAHKAQAALQELRGNAKGVDAALALLRDALLGMNDAATTLHQGGVSHPTYEQIEAFAHRCVLAGLSATSLRRRFETLPPGERNRTMTGVVEQWAAGVERNIAQRLGEPTTNEHEAA